MEDDVFDTEDQYVIRCYCCDSWVRLIATKQVRTGERGDLERWCLACIGEVDSYTLSINNPEAGPSKLDLEGDHYD